MLGVNKVILIGTLGKDPEVNYTDNGICVANFSIAINETYTKKGSDEKIETTEWIKIVLWRGLAEISEKFLKKGSKVYVEGKLKSRKYTDKDQIERYITEIYGDKMQMLDSKSSGDNLKAEQQAAQFDPTGRAHENADYEKDNIPKDRVSQIPPDRAEGMKDNDAALTADIEANDEDDLPF